MNGINPAFLSIDQVQNTYLSKDTSIPKADNTASSSFLDVLKEAGLKEPLKFSKHATARLSERNISLSSEQVERLNMGKVEAGKKGINESLILVDDLSFIVNIPNNTVITAMNQDDENSKVFTNIDGAVIV